MAYPCFCGVEDVKLPVVCWPLFMERVLEKRCPRCGRGIEPQVYWPKNYYAYFCCSCASAIIQGISFAIRTLDGTLISFRPEDLKPHGKEWHQNIRGLHGELAELDGTPVMNTTAEVSFSATGDGVQEFYYIGDGSIRLVGGPQVVEPKRRRKRKDAIPHTP